MRRMRGRLYSVYSDLAINMIVTALARAYRRGLCGGRNPGRKEDTVPKMGRTLP